ncbi:MAG: AraC family transcriptional regulator [Marinifilaceae bacterium]|jgi:AraC-like DNA-binding protein|nr:AraC family transcriptional regulator [Marinifilaceae bacterium]
MKRINANMHFDDLECIHEYLDLDKPKNKFMSVIDLSKVKLFKDKSYYNVSTDFYIITMKQGNNWDLKYGLNCFEFADFGISFIAPEQVVSIVDFGSKRPEGYSLLIHPAFLNNHDVHEQIKECDFFSYKYNRAANISREERFQFEYIFQSIINEFNTYNKFISRQIILTNLELLLLHAKRVYNNDIKDSYTKKYDLLIRVEDILNNYYKNKKYEEYPTVKFLSNSLNIESTELSAFLKKNTGFSTQQLIHQKIMEEAKILLATTDLSVAELAYKLGFSFPQSFSKLFRKKTNCTPLEYRSIYQL